MEARIGMAVCYQQGTDDSPYSYRVNVSSRLNAAQIAYIYPDGTADLVVFPFGYHSHVYVQQIKSGEPSTNEKCWFFP